MSEQEVKVEEPKVDSVVERFVSKKMVVWVTSTVLMVLGQISTVDWLIVTGAYLGVQGVVDAVLSLKGKK